MKLKRIGAALLTALLIGSLAAPAAVAASAQNNYGLSEFVMVLIPGEDTEKAVQLRDNMAKAMSEAIGLPVTTYRATDYNAAVEAMRTGHAQLALLGPFSYVSARERSQAECLVVNGTRKEDGTWETGYYSQIVVKAGSGINTLADLKGRTFAFVDPESTSGNIVPSDCITKELPDLKLTFDALHTDGEFFKSAMFAGTHPSALLAVVNGNVEAAAVSSSTMENQIEQGNVKEGDLKIIYQSPIIPGSPIAIRKDLPQELKDKVKAFLLGYNDDEYFGSPDSRYVEAKDSDYDYLADLKETYGLTD